MYSIYPSRPTSFREVELFLEKEGDKTEGGNECSQCGANNVEVVHRKGRHGQSMPGVWSRK
jgi:hypothetical protein